MAERNVYIPTQGDYTFWKNLVATFDNASPLRRSKDQIIDSIMTESGSDQKSSLSYVRPWNFLDFQCRLHTFKPLSWFAKSHIISPARCARLGWYNKANNTLCCGSCGVELRHDYRNDPNGIVFYQSMVTSHDRHICGWVDESGTCNFSPVTFIQFPVAGVEAQLAALTLHFNMWLRVLSIDCVTQPESNESGDLPHVNVTKRIKIINIPPCLLEWKSAFRVVGPLIDPFYDSSKPDEADTCESKRYASIVAAFLSGMSSKHTSSKSGVGETISKDGESVSTAESWSTAAGQALLLSLFGWEASPDGLAYCSLCNRRFQIDDSSYVSSGNSSSSVDTKKELSCDIVKEHRYFCPWVAPYFAYPDLDDKESHVIAQNTFQDAPAGAAGGAAAATHASSFPVVSTENLPHTDSCTVDGLPGWCIALETLVSCSVGYEVVEGMKEDRVYRLRRCDDTSVGEVSSTTTPSKHTLGSSPNSGDRVRSGDIGTRKSIESSALSDSCEDVNGEGNVLESSGVSTNKRATGESGGDVVYKKIRHVLEMIDK